ncbi:MAG: carboxymuconolactone decarboxylase family protein [Gemmatimonas sp.]
MLLSELPALSELDLETSLLVRLAAVFAGGSEQDIRAQLSAAASTVRGSWIEELVLQTYLFAGFPRALNAAREWRRVSGTAAPEGDEGERYDVEQWEQRGLETCATVYGPLYRRLRVNIRDLHPALDTWMIVEGYGKVLGRPGLDLARRELCIVAACAMDRQERQLHSHLHGALHAGASREAISATLDSIADLVAEGDMRGYRALWARVQGK